MTNIYYNKLIIIFNNIVDILLKIINTYDKPIRKRKYSAEYYLYYITYILNDIKYHYKTIYNDHLKWINLNIYKKAYMQFLDINIFSHLKKSANLVLFIDSTNIYNKHGSEQTGYGKNTKKKRI